MTAANTEHASVRSHGPRSALRSFTRRAAALLLVASSAALVAQDPTAEPPTAERDPVHGLWKGRGMLRKLGPFTGPNRDYLTTVGAAYEWLVDRQEDDGSWPSRHDDSRRTTTSDLVSRPETSAAARFGVTGLAVLAILAEARTDWKSREGTHQPALRKGVAWLIHHVGDAAQLPVCADRAWGVLALVDAAALSDDANLRAAARHGCRILAETPSVSPDDDAWRGACAALFVLAVAWHADLDVDAVVDEALARAEDLLDRRPDPVRSVPLLYLAKRLATAPAPDRSELTRYFDGHVEAERIPALDPIEEAELFDVWHHLACIDDHRVGSYRGPGTYKRCWQLIQARDRCGGFGSSTACAERRTAQALLILVRPYSLAGISREHPTGT